MGREIAIDVTTQPWIHLLVGTTSTYAETHTHMYFCRPLRIRCRYLPLPPSSIPPGKLTYGVHADEVARGKCTLLLEDTWFRDHPTQL